MFFRLAISFLLTGVLYVVDGFGENASEKLLMYFLALYVFWELHYQLLVFSYRKALFGNVLNHVLILFFSALILFVLNGFLFMHFTEVEVLSIELFLFFLLAFSVAGVHGFLIGLRQYEYQVHRELREKKLSLEEKYKAIKSKSILHFLQNSLQATQKLIALDPKKALIQIETLTTLLRSLLQSRDKDFISLKEESDLVKEFVQLLELQGNVKIVFNIEDDPKYHNYKIPPFVLILIFDNIFLNRSFIPYAELQVYVENGIYLVAKYKQLRKASFVQKQEELVKNLKQRYYFTNQDTSVVKISTSSHSFIKVPLLAPS